MRPALGSYMRTLRTGGVGRTARCAGAAAADRWSCPDQSGAVVRMHRSELSTVDALRDVDLEQTVVVVSGGLESLDARDWFEKMLGQAPPVRYRHRLRPHGSFTDYKWVSLGDFVPVMVSDSSHARGVCVLDERALRITGQDAVLDAALPAALRRENCLFERHFPVGLRPPGICLCLGGQGGGTPLHSDVYDWTGWNALFMGEKRWRFFRPDEDAQIAFGTRRQGAAAGTSFSLGAGLHSDVDVYHDARSAPPTNASDPHVLAPPPALERNVPTQVAEVLQRRGDLLIFPASWLHQTYQYGPTIAVACQIMTPANAPRILRHIVSTSGVTRIDASRFDAKMSSAELAQLIRDVIVAALDVKYGDGRGEMIVDYLQWAGSNREEARAVAARLPDHEDAALHPDLQQAIMVLRMILAGA
eukprot:TRINITY_DN1782_c5_g1_i1.p1 TRINITY_DN1782_c5_g1~~TRINITY_DN1782_c5_g1_i1.p1  ORF type:complete len:454 (+),score=123.92 TRINITY_DN1782_c5_g1_i1:112-1362(+)